MLAIDDKERLIEYTKGDEIMEEYSNEAIELNNTYTDMLTWEEDDKLIRESEKLYARDEGIEKGIEAFVKDKIEDGVPEDKVVARLVLRFRLDEGMAKSYYQKYGGK